MPTGRRHLPLLLALLFVSFHLGTPSGADDPNAMAHDGLAWFGFPRGLLPDAVVGFSGSVDGGPFTVELADPCYVQFSSVEVYYHKTITGTVSYGLISDISGIEARKIFFWWPVVRAEAGNGDGTILFDTGLATERHPISEFQDVQQCENSVLRLDAAS